MLPKGSMEEYRVTLRFVRVRIPADGDGDADEGKARGKAKGGGSNWLTIVTDLTEEDGFDAQAIVELYSIRWSLIPNSE